MIRKLLLICVILLYGNLYCEDLNQHISIPLWGDLDSYPGRLSVSNDATSSPEVMNSEEDVFGEKGVFSYPIKRLKETAPYLMNGIVYGWSFTYTPSDKTRHVEEIFELNEIEKVNENQIYYSKPWIERNSLYCWVSLERDERMMRNLKMWKGLQAITVKGRGEGSLKKGFEGIKDATEMAVKMGVREHYRALIKNKPKEIRGRVLIRKEPSIGVVHGNYIVELDFFLETDKILSYSHF